MPRVKGGKVTRQRRKKILKLAKGYFGSKRVLYKTANEQVMRSLAYAYRDRKQRKREFRKLWISRINAAAKLNGMKYSNLIHGLSLAGVVVNRKMLADIAVNEPNDFKAYCELAQKGLKGDVKPAVVEPKKAKEVKEPAKKTEPKEVKEPVKKAEPKVEKKAVDYSAMTLAELKAVAKEKGLTGYSSLKKDELIALLNK